MEKPKLRETPHSSGISPITLNTDWIRKNVQHESCRGNKYLQLCRRKNSEKMSRSWDNRWNSNSGETLIREKNRVWVGIGFQPYPVLQTAPKAPESSRNVIWINSHPKPAKRIDQRRRKKKSGTSITEKYRKFRQFCSSRQELWFL